MSAIEQNYKIVLEPEKHVSQGNIIIYWHPYC